MYRPTPAGDVHGRFLAKVLQIARPDGGADTQVSCKVLYAWFDSKLGSRYSPLGAVSSSDGDRGPAAFRRSRRGVKAVDAGRPDHVNC
jgi:hypothetical protein